MFSTSSKSSSLVLAVVLAAPLLVIAGGLSVAAGVPGVRGSFWPAPDTNLAEAAAVRDYARVRALAARGARLTERLPVRPGLLRGALPAMTALEAAIRIQSPEMVDILFALGANPGFDEARTLHCLALALDAPAAAATFERTYPVAAAACTQGPQ